MDRLQKTWRTKFNESVLERGKTSFENRKVESLKEEGDQFSAAVLGHTRNNVSLTLKNGNPIRMTCRCPMARGGNNCEHMAALLFAIEEKLDDTKKTVEDNSEKDGKHAADVRGKRRGASGNDSNEMIKKETKPSVEKEKPATANPVTAKPQTEILTRRQIGQRLRRLRAKQTSNAQEENERLAEIARLEAMANQTTVSAESTAELSSRDASLAASAGSQKQAAQPVVSTEQHKRAGASDTSAKARRQTATPEVLPKSGGQAARSNVSAEPQKKTAPVEETPSNAPRELTPQEIAERDAKREAREKRKAERAQKEAERKAAADAQRKKQLEKLQAEEARREAIRQEKKAEEERRREKKRQAEEANRLAEERRKKQEEAERKAAQERGAREEAERKAAEARRRQEEEELIRERQEAERIFMEQEAERKAARARQNLPAAEYSLLGDSWQDDSAEAYGGAASLEALEQYSYFDGEAILKNADLPKEARTKGEKLYYQGVVDKLSLSSGYESFGGDDMLGRAIWNGKVGRTEIQTSVIFSRDQLRQADCDCPVCQRTKGRYGWYFHENSDCEYVAAVLMGVRDFLKTHNLGDATDRMANRLLNAYQQKRENLMVSGMTEKESLTLKPRLVKKGGALSVSFKIGTDKLFVIKQLDEFCENVRNAATATYGSNTEFSHLRSNFRDESRKWLRFIEQIVQEEEEFGQRLENATRSRYYYQRTTKVGGSLNLFGWRLDALFNEIGGDTIEYEDRDQVKTKKQLLHCGEGNPRVTIRISEAKMASGTNAKTGSTDRRGRTAKREQTPEEFHGIQVEGALPELYFGMDRAYYVDGDCLYRSDQEFQEKIEDLASLADEEGEFSFRVGRNNLSEFYHQLLPELENIADVVEENPERLHSFVPPQVSFVFYMDASDRDVMCRPFARYEGRELSLLDFLDEDMENHLEMFRDFTAEQDMLYRVRKWLPNVDWKNRELNCGQDEERIYRVMSDGVEELLSCGEVQCTKRFRAGKMVRRMKVSVGVSVSSGLLDLDITTEDVPQEELLDILNSYRQKKNYYRLKDGSYVDLDDESLQLLSELMDSMHLKPKEFVKGKMHLPLYRTLYLNKMLEENESVYSDRDSHFREMVKGFKTVNDADFDVPESLSKIMRPYQKEGYKWLRTLETWQFGGILADDMGLGKTLQMIAVLLAAKEQRDKMEQSGASQKTGKTEKSGDTENVSQPAVSIIISPASLVFNWGEEFARFAPALRVLLITGTQEERQAKIAACEEYDVIVTSYDLLKRDIHLYEDLSFEYEVIDEAQYIKNHTTAAAKAVKVVKSRYRFALTGTPIENRLSELWSIFDYLMPGFLYQYEVFRREMELPIVKYQDEQAMKRLQKMTAPFILRRLKEDVLKDLPDKLEEVRYVRMDTRQQQLYDGQVVHMRETIAGQDADEFNKNKLVILTELMRLRQICCDPSLCFDTWDGESAKADACMQLIMSAIDGGHRMLLFSQFTSMLEILQKRLDAEGISYFTITGSTAKQKRLELVKEFNNGTTPVFLISLKAGGVGLNLTGADVVIHYDPWWNVAAQNQATDRAHRIGQTKKVTVYKLIAKNSIEEKILKLQQDKSALADQVISGETGQLSSMTREDLLELLGGKM
ncbi:MAG: SNF2 helicase associated domain-containing protein [Lachnospiraceae bacterium]|nr:SNF2 helicase associated domain-containing protein [Lachnospiraceae bacterium]